MRVFNRIYHGSNGVYFRIMRHRVHGGARVNPSDVMIGIWMLFLGYMLGISIKKFTEDYMETRKIKKDWEILHKKEPEHE